MAVERDVAGERDADPELWRLDLDDDGVGVGEALVIGHGQCDRVGPGCVVGVVDGESGCRRTVAEVPDVVERATVRVEGRVPEERVDAGLEAGGGIDLGDRPSRLRDPPGVVLELVAASSAVGDETITRNGIVRSTISSSGTRMTSGIVRVSSAASVSGGVST